MPDRFRLLQLSDLHLGGAGPRDPAAALQAAVAAAQALPEAPTAILLSGDLTEHAADAEYELARELLAPLDLPLFVLPGNHDERAALRRHFDLPGTDEEPIQYSAMLGPVRLVVLDSIRPGRERGELDAERLAWLDAELQEEPDVPTLLALHHPPVEIGLEALDCIGIPAEDRAGLADVVRRHPQVRRIVAGHAHRVIVSELEGRAVLVAPSTFAQALLSFSSDTIEFTSEPTGFAVHILCDGEIVSHVQGVAPPS